LDSNILKTIESRAFCTAFLFYKRNGIIIRKIKYAYFRKTEVNYGIYFFKGGKKKHISSCDFFNFIVDNSFRTVQAANIGV
jgi:hypothetical protein